MDTTHHQGLRFLHSERKTSCTNSKTKEIYLFSLPFSFSSIPLRSFSEEMRIQQELEEQKAPGCRRGCTKDLSKIRANTGRGGDVAGLDSVAPLFSLSFSSFAFFTPPYTPSRRWVSGAESVATRAHGIFGSLRHFSLG